VAGAGDKDYLNMVGWDAEPLVLGGDRPEAIRLGQGEPIVILPGLAGGWRLVAPLAARLADRGFEAIICGHRGDYAALGPAGRINRVADLACDLGHVIDSLRLERPTVLGISFGGAVALEWAVAYPHRLGSLVLHGADSRFEQNVGSMVTRHVLERFPLPSNNLFLNQFFNILHGRKPEPSPLVDFVVERCWETDQGVVAQRLRALESFDVTDRLDRIDVPTLVLGGSRDVVVPPKRQQTLARSIPGARFIGIEGAGHIGFLTHAEETVRHVVRHVRGRMLALQD
jgi:pimeloyl-ACP methyl ester carboxylesterase